MKILIECMRDTMVRARCLPESAVEATLNLFVPDCPSGKMHQVADSFVAVAAQDLRPGAVRPGFMDGKLEEC